MSNWDERPESTGAGDVGFKLALPYIIAIIVGLSGIAGVVGAVSITNP